MATFAELKAELERMREALRDVEGAREDVRRYGAEGVSDARWGSLTGVFRMIKGGSDMTLSSAELGAGPAGAAISRGAKAIKSLYTQNIDTVEFTNEPNLANFVKAAGSLSGSDAVEGAGSLAKSYSAFGKGDTFESIGSGLAGAGNLGKAVGLPGANYVAWTGDMAEGQATIVKGAEELSDSLKDIKAIGNNTNATLRNIDAHRERILKRIEDVEKRLANSNPNATAGNGLGGDTGMEHTGSSAAESAAQAQEHTQSAAEALEQATRHEQQAEEASAEARTKTEEAAQAAGEAGEASRESEAKAGEAGEAATEAQAKAGEAGEAATEAQAKAGEAGEAATEAQVKAGEAGEAATEAQAKAGEAGEAATEAQAKAGEAGEAAAEAQAKASEVESIRAEVAQIKDEVASFHSQIEQVLEQARSVLDQIEQTLEQAQRSAEQAEDSARSAGDAAQEAQSAAARAEAFAG